MKSNSTMPLILALIAAVLVVMASLGTIPGMEDPVEPPMDLGIPLRERDMGIDSGPPEPPPVPDMGAQPRWSDEVLALARVCVNETEFATEDDYGNPVYDCGAIIQVALWHADRWPQYENSAELAIRRLSRKSFRRSRTDGRRWIPWLSRDLTRPNGYYRSVTWENGPQLQWQSRLEEVEDYIDGTRPFPCPEPVFHWGGPTVDQERIDRGIASGYWHPVDCGGTLNTFLGPRRRHRVVSTIPAEDAH